ncbi:MAG: hypothetical protein RLZZ507_2260 [Cyanobacteriota bacterium]|jgi:hypothetical protein
MATWFLSVLRVWLSSILWLSLLTSGHDSVECELPTVYAKRHRRLPVQQKA